MNVEPLDVLNDIIMVSLRNKSRFYFWQFKIYGDICFDFNFYFETNAVFIRSLVGVLVGLLNRIGMTAKGELERGLFWFWNESEWDEGVMSVLYYFRFETFDVNFVLF